MLPSQIRLIAWTHLYVMMICRLEPVLFLKQQSQKRKRPHDSQTPPVKRIKLQTKLTNTLPHTSVHITVPNRYLQYLIEFSHLVTRVLSEAPQQILSRLYLSANSPALLNMQFNSIRSALEVVINKLNSLPIPYASAFSDMRQDTCTSNRCHPLLLQVLKPVQTTGDGNCMYNALSLTLTGTELYAHLIRLLCAYALVKYKDTIISAFADAFPNNTRSHHVQMYE